MRSQPRRPVCRPSVRTSEGTGRDTAPLLGRHAPSSQDDSTVRLTSEVPHKVSFSVMNIMHELYRNSGDMGNDVQAEGFKSSVVLWSSAYYVAYALMMTIAFAMLTVVPEPRIYTGHLHYRPSSEWLDSFVQLLYVVFVCWACYDATWGMLLCAEWGVRSGVVPASLYERFMAKLDPNGPRGSTLSQWSWRFFENRAVHHPLPVRGCFTNDASGDRTGIGMAQSPAWDPFYLVDRTVQSLFLGGCTFLYLTLGLLHALVGLYSFISLRERVRKHGLVLSYAMQVRAHRRERRPALARCDPDHLSSELHLSST